MNEVLLARLWIVRLVEGLGELLPHSDLSPDVYRFLMFSPGFAVSFAVR